MAVHVVFVDERGAERVHTIAEGKLQIGRLPENDLVLRDDLVSRKHCVIEKDGDGWKLTDLGSKFGTFLNDERVTGSVPLTFGDRLRVGNTPMTMTSDDAVLETHSGSRAVIPLETAIPGGSIPVAAKIGRARQLADEVLAYLAEPKGQTPPIDAARGVLTRLAELETDLAGLEREKRLAATLSQVGGLIHFVTGLDRVLKATLEMAVQTLGAERGYILLRDADDGPLVPRVSRNMGEMRGISTSIAEQVVESKQEVLTTDATVDPRFSQAHSVMAHGIRAVMCVPLENRDRKAIGAIYVDGRPGSQMFSPQGLEFLKSFASQSAIAIERSQLEEKGRLEQERRERLSRYFSPAVVDDIISKGGDAERLRGQARTVTILFTDIRGFTAMMERLKPADAVEMLNDYFTEIVDELLAEEGTLDKYTGDGIMAFWGAPKDQADHAMRAVRAGLKMQQRMAPMIERWKTQGRSFVAEASGIATGIGIHTGEAVVGSIGSPKRVEYTAIGDAVNLAARVQGVAQGGEVLVTQDTLDLLGGRAEADTLPPVTLKGKSQPVAVFRLKSLKT